MNKKVIVSTLAISALAVNVFAQGSNLGPNGTANGDASLVIGTNNTTTTNITALIIILFLPFIHIPLSILLFSYFRKYYHIEHCFSTI